MTAFPNPFSSDRAARLHRRAATLLLLLFGCGGLALPQVSARQEETVSALTPLQREIERERRRLSSSDEEERRDAVLRLGRMKRPESSLAAVAALKDSSEIVRASATGAVLSLPPDEAAAVLLPLLADKREFVRQEAAYALGQTRSRTVLDGLVAALERDKEPSVRGAAAVALGLIAEPAAAPHLARTLDPNFPVAADATQKGRRKKREDNEFVQRAAAVSLGQMRSRSAVPALITALGNQRMSDDVKREATRALGLIGDPSAIPALRAALESSDPYLSNIAQDALRQIAKAESQPPAS